MRKIVAGIFMSLDGVIESPEKWTNPYVSDEVGQVMGSNMEATDTLLLGRRTYEEFAAYWPDKSAEDDPFADYMNDTPKVVVSTTLKSVEWRNSTLVTGDVEQELTKLKQQAGKNIGVIGSATLVRNLLHERLLDELGLVVCPILVGSGKRLFEDPTEVPLKLTESHSFSNGVLSLTYQPAAS